MTTNLELNALVDILQIIGIIILTISLAGLAYRLIIYKDNADKRTILMQNSSKMLVGALILGSLLTISGFLNTFINTLSEDIPDANMTSIEFNISEDDQKIKDEGNWFTKLLAGSVSWIPDFVLGEPGKPIEEDSIRERLFGFRPLDDILTPSSNDMIFNKTAPESGGKSEWQYILMGYNITRLIAIVLLVIMVFKTGITMIMSSANEKKLEEVKEDIYRWVFVCIIIAIGPILVDGILSLFHWLTTLIKVPSLNTDMLNNVKTGNVIATQAVRLYYTYLTVNLNVMFMVSKWCLAVMIIFTPIAATLWGINKRFHAFEIWLGEIISNGAMRLCYTIVFLALNLVFMSGQQSMVMILIGLTLVIKLGDVLRNSLNGIIARIGGMDEASHASSLGRGSLNGVKRLAMATGGAVGLMKGLTGNGDNAEQFAKMGNSHNLSKAVNGEGSGAKAGAVAEMMNTEMDNSPDEIASDIVSGGNKPNTEAAVQDMFMNNLAQKNAYGNRSDGMIMRGINAKANKNLINEAKEDTISQMADVYKSQGMDSEQANIKARTEFNKNMYGAENVDADGDLTRKGSSIDRKFSSKIAKGQYHIAKKNLSNSNRDENVRNLFKDAL
ncbi:MAG: hypothetical protein RR620_08450 [Clostridium sp.]